MKASVLLLLSLAAPLSARTKPRARDLGLSTKIGGTAGTLDAMAGINDTRVYALPVDRLLATMKKFGR